MPPENPVPTFSVGGFLGAGKTTFVNDLLSNTTGQRFVVFVNDFGAINIDYDLIETVEEDRVSLANGCVCCTLNDELIESIVRFCETPPDAFVIEASGVANPKSLEDSLNAVEHAGYAYMKRRVYVMDADQFGGLDYADTEDLIDHAAASDLIVLNKCDLVSQSRRSEIEAILTRSAPNSMLLSTSYGRVAAALLTAPSAKKLGRKRVQLNDGHATNVFETCSFERFEVLSRERLSRLTETMKGRCLRAKGVIYIDDAPSSFFRLQLVGNRISLEEIAKQSNEPHPKSQLVAIGWRDRMNQTRFQELLGEPVINLR